MKNKKCGCERCDGPGMPITYANQVCMPLNGKVVCIDWCIHHLVAALNAAGIFTTMSCCGHRIDPGVIFLEDGRVLAIFESKEDWERQGLTENLKRLGQGETEPQVSEPQGDQA
jgi:hypothetical protein